MGRYAHSSWWSRGAGGLLVAEHRDPLAMALGLVVWPGRWRVGHEYIDCSDNSMLFPSMALLRYTALTLVSWHGDVLR